MQNQPNRFKMRQTTQIQAGLQIEGLNGTVDWNQNSEKSEEFLPLLLLHMVPTVARDQPSKSLIIPGNASCKDTNEALGNGNSITTQSMPRIEHQTCNTLLRPYPRGLQALMCILLLEKLLSFKIFSLHSV